MINTATWFTILRIALVPGIMQCINLAQYHYAFILFLIAALTDIIDGFIARRFNQITPFGTLLDPVADKLLILGCLVALWNTSSVIPTWFFAALLIKEVLLIAGGFIAWQTVSGIDLKADWFGKVAMLLQVLLVGWLLASAMIGAKMPNFVMSIVIGVNAIALVRYALRIKNIQRLLGRRTS